MYINTSKGYTQSEERSKRHKAFMLAMETKKHRAEESIEQMLDRQRDQEYAQQIATHRGGYSQW